MIDQVSLESIRWPASRIGEAISYFAQSLGSGSRSGNDVVASPPIHSEHGRKFNAWLGSVAARFDLELVTVASTYGQIDEILRCSGPLILRLPADDEDQYLVLISCRRRHATVVAPDLSRCKISLAAIADQIRRTVEEDPILNQPIDTILGRIGLRGKQQSTARAALFQTLHRDHRLADAWMIRTAATAPLRTLANESRIFTLLGSVAFLHLIQYTLWIIAWWLLGWISVHGRFEPALFYAWMLLLVGRIPFRILGELTSGSLAIRAGLLLKRRLLAGAFRLESQEVRRWGIGQLLGRVIESDAVETLAVSGGLLALTAVVELLITFFVLASGAGGWLHVLLLLATLVCCCLLGWRYYRSQFTWTEQRLQMTNELVEQMIGHRTRLAQQSPERWNEGEDENLERYLLASRQIDRRSALLVALISRGWLILGIVALAPVLIRGTSSTVSLAIGLGGVLLAFQALGNLVEGGLRLSIAMIAWQRVSILIRAARRMEPIGSPHASSVAPCAGQSLITAQDLCFRHRGRSQPVLQGFDVTVHSGDRILLQGKSGGGKSTLASLLAGSRVPESGLLLLHGLDRETLGAAQWRRRVVLSPQFHENHVLMGPLCFNLLLGRNWPPTQLDLAEAQRTCEALGLGPLIDRMPGGMFQIVGETGWQLSHGEKSRVFLARAILQQAELMILDETFAALDPPNLERSLRYVLSQPNAVIVIAHP